MPLYMPNDFDGKSKRLLLMPRMGYIIASILACSSIPRLESWSLVAWRRDIINRPTIPTNLEKCWNYSYCGHVPDSIGITGFVRTESYTSVDIVYARKTTYGRSYSAV
jgi:hypothetical protein